MAESFPPIAPYAHGMLDVGDGQRVYWEQSGNPKGKPVVLLHGGPGAGWNEGVRTSFDPAAYRIIAFDQRQCGRSTPNAGDGPVDLSVNTTAHLLADIEQLREHLGVERWMVFGGSWGSTLGLVYAERWPERVTGVVLVAVTTTRRAEIDWLYRGAGRFFPEQHERFLAGAPAPERDGDIVAAYHRLLMSPDPAVHHKAADDWCAWEFALVNADPDTPSRLGELTPRWKLAFARLVTHYFMNLAWLDEGQVLRDAHRLTGIPGILIHGRLDWSGPPATAWEVARAWPDARLVLVKDAGHSTREGGMKDAILSAIAEFAHRP